MGISIFYENDNKEPLYDCILYYTTGATCGTGAAYPSESPEFTPRCLGPIWGSRDDNQANMEMPMY